MFRFLLALVSIAAIQLLPANAQTFEKSALSGKIWRASDGEFISVSKLLEEIAQKQFILIGERHGRKAHQNREAFLIGALAEKQRYPVIAMEMIAQDQTEIIRKFRKSSPEHPMMLARDLEWENSNWPAWSYYLPIFEAAFLAKLNVVGADVSSDHAIGDRVNSLTSDPKRSSWSESLRRAHCNLIEEDRLQKLTELQIERELSMSSSMLESTDHTDGVILIAGSSHVRNDRGVPTYLPAGSFASIALLETNPDKPRPIDHLPKSINEGGPVFDYVWFTPRIPKENVCARFNQ